MVGFTSSYPATARETAVVLVFLALTIPPKFGGQRRVVSHVPRAAWLGRQKPPPPAKFPCDKAAGVLPLSLPLFPLGLAAAPPWSVLKNNPSEDHRRGHETRNDCAPERPTAAVLDACVR